MRTSIQSINTGFIFGFLYCRLYINANNDGSSLDAVPDSVVKESDALQSGVVAQSNFADAPTAKRATTTAAQPQPTTSTTLSPTVADASAAASAVASHLQLDDERAASRVQYHRLLTTPLVGDHRSRQLIHADSLDVAFDFSLRLTGWMCHREYDLKWHGKRVLGERIERRCV